MTSDDRVRECFRLEYQSRGRYGTQPAQKSTALAISHRRRALATRRAVERARSYGRCACERRLRRHARRSAMTTRASMSTPTSLRAVARHHREQQSRRRSARPLRRVLVAGQPAQAATARCPPRCASLGRSPAVGHCASCTWTDSTLGVCGVDFPSPQRQRVVCESWPGGSAEGGNASQRAAIGVAIVATASDCGSARRQS
jgi:hypothetical protein